MKKKCSELQIKSFLEILYLLKKQNVQDVHSEISGGEFYALYNIFFLQEESKSENVRISHLGERIGLSPQAVSKTLRSLEKKGYTIRITDPDDRRITLISLTDKGREKLQNAKEKIYDFSDKVSKRMGEDDMREFLRLSGKCNDIMKEVLQEMTENERTNSGKEK